MASVAEISLVISGRNDASKVLNDVSGDLKGINNAANAVSFAVATNGAAQFGASAGSAIGKVTGLTASSSSLNEALNKSNVIFKENGKEIEKWAAGGAKDFGLSKSAALSAAGSFGNMFTQLGVGREEAAGMSMSIVELATDFASFHDADITDVIDSQSAAFRGEYDSLQKYLPLINAATVEQKALEMTGKATTKELTAQDKALAVNALMFEGAGEAAGDFDRTAGGLANTQRTLTAETENSAAAMGDKLVPAQQLVIGLWRDMPGPIQAAAGVMKTFGGDTIGMAAGLGQAALGLKAMGPLMTGMAGGMKTAGLAAKALSLTMLAPPLGIVIALVAIGVAAYVFRDEIIGAFKAAADFVIPKAEAIGQFIMGAFNSIVDFFKNNWQTIGLLISGPFLPIVALATDAFGVRTALVNAFQSVLGWLSSAWGVIYDYVIAPYVNLIGAALDLFGLRTALVNGFNAVLEFIVGLGGAAFNAAMNLGQSIFNGIMGPINELLQWVEDKIGKIIGLVEKVSDAVSKVAGFGGGKSLEQLAQEKLVQAQTNANIAAALQIRLPVPTYASGTPYVPYDQLAFVHKGERITPANENERMTGRGVIQNIYGPVTIVNQNGEQDVNRTMADLAFGYAAEMRSRGVLTT